MKKETKTTKKLTTAKSETKKAVAKSPAKAPAKSTKSPIKAEKVKSVIENKVVETTPVVKEVKVEKATETKAQAKKVTLNQELNLLIGLFSLITIISFCFAFQGGETEILGWELFLKAGEYYSGVLQGVMILFVIAIFIDCILAIRIDTDNEIINIVEKVLYMFTAIMNFIVIAILLSLIAKVGIGLLIFFVISIISAIVKFARFFAQK